MKYYCLVLMLWTGFLSCNKTSEENQLKIEQTSADNTNLFVVGVGKIIPEYDIIQLYAPVNGIVHVIYKKKNDTVHIGSVILELDHLLEDEKVTQLTNQVNTQMAQIKVDLAGISEYQVKADYAAIELQHSKNLLLKGAATEQQINNEELALKALQYNVQKLTATVIVAENRLKELKTAVKIAQLEREQKIIRSPINGRMLELTVLIGGSVSTLQAFGQIAPEGKTIAICEIDETNAYKVVVGQKGWVRSVGALDTISVGTVFFVYSFLNKKSLFTDQSGEKEDRRVLTIKLLLDNPQKLLLNSRVECVIDVSSNLITN